MKLKDGDSSTVSGFRENWKSVSVKVNNWLQSAKFIPEDQELTPGMLYVQTTGLFDCFYGKVSVQDQTI